MTAFVTQVRTLLVVLGAVVGTAVMNVSQHPDFGPQAGGNASLAQSLWGAVLGASLAFVLTVLALRRAR